MITARFSRFAKAQPGATLTEYAMLLGLIGVVSILGLNSLGGSTSALLTNASTKLAGKGPMNVLKAPVQGTSGSVQLQGSGYYRFAVDPKTGQPTLQLGSGGGVPTNVTSVDGNFNTLGTMMLANKLNQLAEQETDPALKDYYGQIAKLSYYLGGAEGELDDVPGLDRPRGQYGNGSALRDVLGYGAQLQTLLNNPPANFKQTQDFTEVMPMAVDVYNIAQNYKNNLSQFIQPDGSVIDFGAGPNTTSGDGKAGSVLDNSGLVAVGSAPVVHYDSLIPYAEMKRLSDQVLSDNKVESAPVESTLTDATVVDTVATQSSSP